MTRDYYDASLLSHGNHFNTHALSVARILTCSVTVSSTDTRQRCQVQWQDIVMTSRHSYAIISVMIQDGIVGASAPAEHVVRGLSGWRWQPLLATKRVADIVAEALFTTLLWRESFPLMPSTEAQAAGQAREAVLAYY